MKTVEKTCFTCGERIVLDAEVWPMRVWMLPEDNTSERPTYRCGDGWHEPGEGE